LKFNQQRLWSYICVVAIIFASSAIVVSDASAIAPEWKINGVAIAKPVVVDSKSLGADGAFEKKIGGVKYKIKCKDSSNQEELLPGSPTETGKDEVLAQKFENCSVEEPKEAGCTAVVIPLKINEWKSTLKNKGGKIENEFAKIEVEITVAGCASAAAYRIRATLVSAVDNNVAGGKGFTDVDNEFNNISGEEESEFTLDEQYEATCANMED
jgi:hypothetical protein